MKNKNILALLSIISIVIALLLFLSFGSGRGFKSYLASSEYRRMHPELVPSPFLIRMFDAGHTSTYASLEWLKLIQFIADNISNNGFLDFSHTILDNITELNPYFERPYEIDLIFAPVHGGENRSEAEVKRNKEYTSHAIALGKKGITQLCDAHKIQEILKQDISESLWNRDDLRNPCTNGMLPYYIAFALSQGGEDKSEASDYYKIASMNEDAPKSSAILSLLAKSADGDRFASAYGLFLVAANGYDVEPYACRKLAGNLIPPTAAKIPLTGDKVRELQEQESKLQSTKDENNPNSLGNNNCYELLTRGIAELYLGYISDIAKGTDAKNGDDLIRLGKIGSIPLLKKQKNMGVYNISGRWQYRQK